MASRTKKLDRLLVERVVVRLRPLLKDRYAGNVTHMAKAMRVSQPQLRSILRGGDRGIGIAVLLAIREYLGDVTLDDLLGLPPPRSVPVSEIELALERVIDRRLGGPPPPEPSRPLLPPAPPPSGKKPGPRPKN